MFRPEKWKLMSTNICTQLLIINFVQKTPGIRQKKKKKKNFYKRWMSIQIWVYPHEGILLKNQCTQQPGWWSGTLCWVTKANFKRSLLYDSRRVTFSKWQNHAKVQTQTLVYSGEHSCLPDIKQISGLGMVGEDNCVIIKG